MQRDVFHKKYLQEEMNTKRFLKSIAYEVQLNCKFLEKNTIHKKIKPKSNIKC